MPQHTSDNNTTWNIVYFSDVAPILLVISCFPQTVMRFNQNQLFCMEVIKHLYFSDQFVVDFDEAADDSHALSGLLFAKYYWSFFLDGQVSDSLQITAIIAQFVGQQSHTIQYMARCCGILVTFLAWHSFGQTEFWLNVSPKCTQLAFHLHVTNMRYA